MSVNPTIQLLLQDVDHELGTTRRVLERVPGDRLAWRPHAKSWTLGELATHVARLPMWGAATIDGPAFDLASLPAGPGPVAGSPGELLGLFDEHAAALRASLAGMLAADAETALGARWSLRHGATELMALPRALALRTFVFNHLVHHRGQLSVYFRLLDVPVPAMYGPSADER